MSRDAGGKTTARPEDRAALQRLAFLLILLTAFALRLFRLPDANIWWDEGLAVWAARMPIIDMVRWTSVDVHPPLYFALLHFWRIPLGDSEFAVRLLSAMLGTLTVAAGWQFGRALFPDRPHVAMTAALWLALARFPIWWSQEARMYALGGFLFTLSLYFTVRLRRRPAWPAAIGYLLSTIAALWTLYLLAFTLIIEGLYWLWTLRHLPRREVWGKIGAWAAYQLVVLAAFLPWLAYALPRMRTWSVQTAFDPKIYLELYATLLWVGESVHVERFRGVIALGMGLVLLGVVAGWMRARRDLDGLALLLLTLVIPPAVVWLATTMPRSFGYSPKPEARYLLPFTPPFYLLATWAFITLVGLISRPRWRKTVLIGLLTILLLGQASSLRAYYQQRYLQDDYKSLSRTLAARVLPEDIVFLHTDQPWPVFAYHWPREFKGWPNGQDADPASVEHWVKPLWERHEGFWLVVNEDALRADSQRLVETWLTQRALARHEWRFGPKRLILFARTPQRADKLLALAPGWTPPPPAQPLAASGVRVVGWEQPLRRVKQGDFAHVALTLEGASSASNAPILLTLGDPPQARREVTPPPGSGLWRQTLTLIPPPGAPAGPQPYRLSLGAVSAIMGWVMILPEKSVSPAPERAAPRHPITAVFGDPPLVWLRGYDLDGNLKPGGKITLTLYWQVERTTDVSYKVFVHLIGADGRPAAQGDDFPLAGQRPTTTWQPGESLVDRYTIQLPADLPPGDYPLRIGFYDPTTGVRLSPVLDASGATQPDDQFQLDVVTISAP